VRFFVFTMHWISGRPYAAVRADALQDWQQLIGQWLSCSFCASSRIRWWHVTRVVAPVAGHVRFLEWQHLSQASEEGLSGHGVIDAQSEREPLSGLQVQDPMEILSILPDIQTADRVPVNT
jgi:hypothetical protein